MRTPEEVKAALDYCINPMSDSCTVCPYQNEDKCSECLIREASTLVDASGTKGGGDEMKRYTTFDIIDMVQHIVSNEICGMDVEDSAIGYEIERGIVAKLVENERKTED